MSEMSPGLSLVFECLRLVKTLPASTSWNAALLFPPFVSLCFHIGITELICQSSDPRSVGTIRFPMFLCFTGVVSGACGVLWWFPVWFTALQMLMLYFCSFSFNCNMFFLMTESVIFPLWFKQDWSMWSNTGFLAGTETDVASRLFYFCRSCAWVSVNSLTSCVPLFFSLPHQPWAQLMAQPRAAQALLPCPSWGRSSSWSPSSLWSWRVS